MAPSIVDLTGDQFVTVDTWLVREQHPTCQFPSHFYPSYDPEQTVWQFLQQFATEYPAYNLLTENSKHFVYSLAANGRLVNGYSSRHTLMKHVICDPEHTSVFMGMLTPAATFTLLGNACCETPERDTCAVCLESLHGEVASSVFLCNHAFHLDCVSTQEVCPLCRQPLELGAFFTNLQ